MYLAQSPRLMQIDPYRIKFHPANPRKHCGLELLRLKKSLEKVGMVQFPTVRDLSDEFVECLDGEGRALAAQENHEPRIWVVNLGKLHDADALLMLQAANAVRTFGWLEECRGLSNLHRQGESIPSLADKFSLDRTKVGRMVDIGYFPDAFLKRISDAMAQSEEQAQPWSLSLLVELLPLRQEHAGKDPSTALQHGQTLDDVYEYTEVRRAIERVFNGTITDAAQMRDYVAQRRLDLFKARFDQALHAKVAEELEHTKQALEVDYSDKLKLAQQVTIQAYEKKVRSLQEDRDDLEKSYQAVIGKAAKQSEQVDQLQKGLKKKEQEVARKRHELEELQRKAQDEADAKARQLQEEKQRQLEEERRQLSEKQEQEYAQRKADLESYYARREQELQLTAETNIHQIVADCARHLTETQLAVLNLLSPDVLKGVAWLRYPEMKAFIAQLQTVRETLEKAEEQLLHENMVFDSERRHYDGSQAYQESLERG